MDKYKYSYLDDKGIYCYENSNALINKLNIRSEKIFFIKPSSTRQSELNVGSFHLLNVDVYKLYATEIIF